MSSARLYNAELLGLAASLAQVPLDDGLGARGTARSPTCGSVVEIGLVVDDDGLIARVGVKAQACAVGQAAAAIFAAAAVGSGADRIAATIADVESWLAGGALPDWPGMSAIAAARDYPARHAAMLLPWRAALAALERHG